MKMFHGIFPSLVLACLFVTSILVRADDDQSGFISIDCGIAKGSSYTDNVTGINYVSDADFIDSGEPRNILPLYNSSAYFTQLITPRSFPENIRNCYTLKPTQGKGNRYLIRVSFMYGNYDLYSRYPEFDVYLGPDYWDTIKFNFSAAPASIEIIHVSPSDYIHVCLVNTGHGTPFISTIELRLLGINMYAESDYGPLSLFKRTAVLFRYGLVRYKADKYDRLWMIDSITMDDSYVFETNDIIYSDPYTNIDPPSEVMTVAIGPMFSDSIEIRWYPVNASDKFFIYLHFAETQILKSNHSRVFNIYLNGNYWDGPISPQNRTTTTIYSRVPEIAAPSYTLTINRTEKSKLRPIINALELYTLKPPPQRQTDDQDAAALWNIKSSYKVTKHWQGDPCVPQEFVWDGVRCSYNDTESPRIIYLNLSTSGLNGVIYPGIANLTRIHTLDLSKNNLTGTVPKFLANLNYLKVLNLKGNHFSGQIPTELLTKAKEGSLSLSFDGEGNGDISGSCDTNHCKSKKDNKFIVPVVATAASLFIILIAITAIWMIKTQKARGKRRTGMELEIKRQEYTYSDVRSMTNNFNVVLGKGGFGTVYYGHIDDTQVAVKILSRTSHQGDKEFQAEANLLLNIHHKNITSLVGYCNEGIHKGIIYEYMANGDLESHIYDASSRVLKWEERLQIGCDAAHGLEYLHHGCKPGIVHRDIKCTNILLNETFQAKLADFGLSKVFPTEGGTHISTVVAGTPGYLDPEYYTSNRLTKKSDVYSFGVVILVLITGQPAITRYENENIHIIRWVNLMLADGNVNIIVDPRLTGDYDINSAWKLVELAMACVDHIPSKRPTMNEVAMELNDCLVMERARQETEPKKLYGFVSLNLESAYGPNPR